VTETACSNCGAAVPAGARFCPECGSRRSDGTRVEPVPQSGTEPLSVRHFGTAPQNTLLWLGLALVVAALILLALAQWAVGAILLAFGAAVAAFYALAAAPDSRRLAAARSRGRAVVETVAAQSQARRALLALRMELQSLVGERGERLRALGQAVYDGDAAGTERERAAIRALDDRIAAKEDEMTRVAEHANHRVEQARLEAHPTVLLEPPAPLPPEPSPPSIPEPYPPPDEGTPPTPAPVPEPYPPPDEGSPPRQI
jgi:Na+-transporting methylmalonyl-CoA/oxaloacetate decarboxylase gamma subunit